ncbi:MAG: 23S rRNA (uracil(1939)-C(5))-methyltransferase RlmD [Planctomycetes bacterium]|nr:23S rRNA (uracil(1939)-C(5))-methyltransferase RlmD [Planctomycetota bacterium]
MLHPRPRKVPVARGDQLELDVVGLGDGPDGVGKVDDYVVFVPGTLPGERAAVTITSAARKFARGELQELLTLAPERTEPHCPHFLACGGCHRQHQAYAAQLAWKQATLQRALDRALGDGAPRAEPTVAARPPHGQRHKVVVHLRDTREGGLEPCFHRLRSPELVAVRECPASDPFAWDLALRTVELLQELPHGAWDPDFAQRGLLRSVLVRATTAGEASVLLVAREPRIPDLDRIVEPLHRAGATTIAVNHNRGEFSQLLGRDTAVVSGPPRIAERLLGFTYLISPAAFFQTSPQAAAHLVERVVGWLAPTREHDAADLYCGTGLSTLPLAARARSVFGIELSLAAVHDAEAAARQNGLRNVTFRAGHVEGWLARCRAGELPRPHLVALDPPRAGLAPAVVAGLERLRPARIAYVSCDLEALQRDLRALQTAGFRLAAAVPIDMFPHTCHVESLACLEAAK